MKTAALTALLAFAPVALAQTAPATPQAAMTQFCQTLTTGNWKIAMGNMLGIKEETVSFIIGELADNDKATQQLMDDMLRKGRCEVVSAQGNQVRIRASGADAAKAIEMLSEDKTVLRAMLENMQGTKTDAELEQVYMQGMQRLYRTAQLPVYSQSITVKLEKTRTGWVLTEDSIKDLSDALLGGASRLR